MSVNLRNLTAACAAMVYAGVAASPAVAAKFTATFTGTLYGAADFAGLFGAPGTDISGQAFTAVYHVDTEVTGIVEFTSQQTSFLYSGEYYYGGLPTAMSVALTVGGQTQTIIGNYKGLIIQENDFTPGYPRVGNGDELFYQLDGYDHATTYSSLSFSIEDVVTDILPTDNYAAPGHYHFTGATLMDNRFSFAAYGANLAYGSLRADDLVVSGVPETSEWMMLVPGLAITVLASRRRRQPRSVISA